MVAWRGEDRAAARREGWDLFDVDEPSQVRLQRLDPWQAASVAVQRTWEDDTEVWEYVMADTSPLHEKAVGIVRDGNPEQYRAMRRWVTRSERHVRVQPQADVGAGDRESVCVRVHEEHTRRMAPRLPPGTDVTWRDKAGELNLGTVEAEVGDGTYEVVIGWDGNGYVETVERVAGQDLSELATVHWDEAVEAVGAGIDLEDYLNARYDGADHDSVMAAKRDFDMDPADYGFELRSGRPVGEIVAARNAGGMPVHRKNDGGTVNVGWGRRDVPTVTANVGRPPAGTWLAEHSEEAAVVAARLEAVLGSAQAARLLDRAEGDRFFAVWLTLVDHWAEEEPAGVVPSRFPWRAAYEQGWTAHEAVACRSRSRPLPRSSRRLRAGRQRRRMARGDRIAGGLGRAYRLPRGPVRATASQMWPDGPGTRSMSPPAM